MSFFFWRAFITFKSERRSQVAGGSDFQEEDSRLRSGIFKGLSPSTTPFGKRNLDHGFGFTIPKVTILSILRMALPTFTFE
jgi:hypothetical protein